EAGPEAVAHEDEHGQGADGDGLFAEAGPADAVDINAVALLGARVADGGVVVAAVGGDDLDAPAAGGQLLGGVGHVLADAGGVGGVDLAEDEDRLVAGGGHGLVTSAAQRRAEALRLGALRARALGLAAFLLGFLAPFFLAGLGLEVWATLY